ncbi:TonB-linked outer membrane protein, SusC/RagA family [Pedobacter nyackensis]|uniref:TonB-linked outer membrane protein, SusC/RagA family n=2 Tax=Pedobacter nyackensis TaxID=475255 RepID=A0A1W2AIB4_9SPHI|nr:TonB-linked outer membrane protein, SusC/RagA family [Pedobacter nyackensis]
MAALCLNFKAEAQSQNTPPPLKNQAISGKVISATTGEALPGAVIKVTTTNHTVISNDKGEFILTLGNGTYNLSIYYLSYKTKNISIQIPLKESLIIALDTDDKNLKEVEIVSTGYQNIPKERATGSFTTIDNELLNRRVGTNILDRLDGVTSALIFNKSKTQNTQSDLNIRGRSTIFGEDKPLIILDNFPYEGEITNINPNDIKNINILKDAAAASIWGTRAGNGVIVITTYKGSYQSKLETGINTNLTIGAKPDLYQPSWFSSSQYIDIEQYLFNQGAYTSTISNGYTPISAAIVIMDAHAKNKISRADSLKQIDALKNYDIRRDMLKYLYRPSTNQQYSFYVKGGSNQNKYFISAGYDRNLASRITNSYNRYTLNANNSFTLLNNKLEINAGIILSSSSSRTINQGYSSPASPYERLANEQGNALAVQRGLRLSYVDMAAETNLLDWYYKPLEENKANSHTKLTSYILNAGLNYSIIKNLKLALLYQHQTQLNVQNDNYNADSHYARDIVNRYSVIDHTTGSVQRPIPQGGIVNDSRSQYESNFARFQINYDKSIGNHHNISAIAGMEVRNNYTTYINQRFYGFNEETFTNANSAIDFTKDYTILYSGNTGRIDAGQGSGYMLDRYLSYFVNTSYELHSKYILSLSARKDESNLFGVKPNQRGIPLWSAGLLWNINKEPFYKLSWLPHLKLRGSYGYTGNVSKNLTALLTASAGPNNRYGSAYYTITNPPNPSLKWERIKIINAGLDFATINNRLSGSIDPYIKYGIDLFGESPLAPQAGVATFKGNTANTLTKGLDLLLNSNNLNGPLKWTTNLTFSINKDKVTSYNVANGLNTSVISSPYNSPLAGNPFFSIYAYKWAGLDNKGDPQVMLDGKPSKDYSLIFNSSERSNIRYIGSSVPTKYGNIRNSFAYKSIEISLNIVYRLGYFFRRASLDNTTLYSTGGYKNAIDYDKRWRNPGDEKITNVPALLYPAIGQRDNTYMYSDILVEKADNIRLQDIRLNWNLNGIKNISKYFSKLQVYGYINNLGYLWKANKLGLDPDVPRPDISNVSTPRTIAIGIKADL